MPAVIIGGDTVLKDDDKINNCVPDQPFRLGVFGQSESGKTAWVITLIYNLVIHALFCYPKHADSQQWKALREMCEKALPNGEPTLYSHFEPDIRKVIPLDQILLEGWKMVAVFDDQQEVADRFKEIIGDYIFNGRHCGRDEDGYGGMSTVHIANVKTGLEKSDRKNLSCFMLFKGLDLEDLKHFHELSGQDLDFDDFFMLYKACVAIKYGFLFFDLKAPNISAKYRFCFDCLLKTIEKGNSVTAEIKIEPKKPKKNQSKNGSGKKNAISDKRVRVEAPLRKT